MIVPESVANGLVAGRVTQVRLPAHARRCPFRVGGDYAIQPHSVDRYTVEGDDREFEVRNITGAVGRVQVLEVRRTTLEDLTYEDARAEGIRGADWRTDHAAMWRAHRRSSVPEQPVWVLTVRPHVDVVRLLAPSGSQAGRVPETGGGPAADGEHRDDEHDYTSSSFGAMDVRTEPEAIDVDRLHPDWKRDAQARLDAVRRQRTVDQELAFLLDQAQALGVDVSSQLASIEKRVQALRRRIGHAARGAA